MLHHFEVSIILKLRYGKISPQIEYFFFACRILHFFLPFFSSMCMRPLVMVLNSIIPSFISSLPLLSCSHLQHLCSSIYNKNWKDTVNELTVWRVLTMIIVRSYLKVKSIEFHWVYFWDDILRNIILNYSLWGSVITTCGIQVLTLITQVIFRDILWQQRDTFNGVKIL